MANDNNLDMGDLLEQRIMENFANQDVKAADVSDERLKEMNKKLPKWSLEPPFSFLK